MPRRRGSTLSAEHRASIAQAARAREENRRNQQRERNRSIFMRSLNGEFARVVLLPHLI